MTRQRRIILEELRKVRTHPSADEVYLMVRKRLPRISLGTVYRNLELLCEGGLAQRVDCCGRSMRFDGDVRHHYHVRCLRCGRVGDVAGGPLAELERHLGPRTEFRIVAHRLELLGVCPRCGNAAGAGTGGNGVPNARGGSEEGGRPDAGGDAGDRTGGGGKRSKRRCRKNPTKTVSRGAGRGRKCINKKITKRRTSDA